MSRIVERLGKLRWGGLFVIMGLWACSAGPETEAGGNELEDPGVPAATRNTTRHATRALVEDFPSGSASDFPVVHAEEIAPNRDSSSGSALIPQGEPASTETPKPDPTEDEVRVVIEESKREPIGIEEGRRDPVEPTAVPDAKDETGSTPPTEASSTSSASGESPTMVAEAVRLDARSPADHFSDDALVSLLVARARNSLTSTQGGIGERSSDTGGEVDIKTARRLAALTVSSTFVSPEDEALDSAISALQKGQDTEKLLAAACFLEKGMPESAREVLSTVQVLPAAEPEADAEVEPEAVDTTSATATFRLEKVGFATAIEGTGKFTPAARTSYACGDTILVYGEFHGARALAEETEAGKTRYRQAFAGRLRLVSPEGNEIESVEFLPEPKGGHLARDPDEAVNFWARYRVPAGLEAGAYRLEVEATDSMARETTTVEIPFAVES